MATRSDYSVWPVRKFTISNAYYKPTGSDNLVHPTGIYKHCDGSQHFFHLRLEAIMQNLHYPRGRTIQSGPVGWSYIIIIRPTTLATDPVGQTL